jgi:hypothetical protein
MNNLHTHEIINLLLKKSVSCHHSNARIQLESNVVRTYTANLQTATQTERQTRTVHLSPKIIMVYNASSKVAHVQLL